ncbi:MAG: IS200/IS605 family transposase [Chloroflexota bacterium]|nr:IS200/IS605 family transposase [Chloroflexota bacterium]
MPFAITYYHIVWTTHERQPMIERDHVGPLMDAIDEACEKLGCKIYALSVLPDHLHIAVSIPPRIAVLDWVRDMKIASARAVHKALPAADDLLWDRGCGVITFGTQNKDKVIRYVKRQRAIHAEGQLIDALEKTNQ